jgi:hypothetical protein
LVGDDRDGDGISGLYHVAGLRVGTLAMMRRRREEVEGDSLGLPRMRWAGQWGDD